MLTYIIRRLGLAILTLLLVTFVIYGLIRAMPGSPLESDPLLSDPSIQPSEEDLERIRKIYGLDKPWYIAYFIWLGNVCQGEMGDSIVFRQPVMEVIAVRVGPTLLLSITSLVLSYVLAVPMGLYSTVRSGKPDERALSVTLYMLYSLPTFVAALYLQLLLAVKLEWLPLFGMTDSSTYGDLSMFGKAWDIFLHMLMPTFCFTYGSLAYYSRFVKANMEEVIRQDYIRTARAKGVGPVRVIVHHAFRNTLIPFVTLMGLTLPVLLSGAVILEQIFNWPGMGELFFVSILRRDYEVIMGLTFILSVLTLLGQLLADLLYAFVDPRISYS